MHFHNVEGPVRDRLQKKGQNQIHNLKAFLIRQPGKHPHLNVVIFSDVLGSTPLKWLIFLQLQSHDVCLCLCGLACWNIHNTSCSWLQALNTRSIRNGMHGTKSPRPSTNVSSGLWKSPTAKQKQKVRRWSPKDFFLNVSWFPFHLIVWVLLSVGPACNITWDGWLCWDETEAGVTTEQSCPDYYTDFDTHGKAIC